VEQPWGRVVNPVDLPPRPTVKTLIALGDDEFAVLVRDHLLPRGENRSRWNALWAVLTFDERLSERTFDVLENFLDTTQADLAAGALDEQQHRRAIKFIDYCDDAWVRLQRRENAPLAWAGAQVARYNPAARAVLETLAKAVAEHRSAVSASEEPVREADTRLWQVLATVGLDPQTQHRAR